jgi:hypothetical protein
MLLKKPSGGGTKPIPLSCETGPKEEDMWTVEKILVHLLLTFPPEEVGARNLASVWAFAVQWIWKSNGTFIVNDQVHSVAQCCMKGAKLGAPWALVAVGQRLAPGETIEVAGKPCSQIECFQMASSGNMGSPMKVLQDAIAANLAQGIPVKRETAVYWRELGKTVIGDSTVGVNDQEYSAKECHLRAIEEGRTDSCVSLSERALLQEMMDGEVIQVAGVLQVKKGNALFHHTFSAEEAEVEDRQAAAVMESLMCLLCTSSQRNCALLPCYHMCTCSACAVKLNAKCPICRKDVTRVIPIYLS